VCALAERETLRGLGAAPQRTARRRRCARRRRPVYRCAHSGRHTRAVCAGMSTPSPS